MVAVPGANGVRQQQMGWIKSSLPVTRCEKRWIAEQTRNARRELGENGGEAQRGEVTKKNCLRLVGSSSLFRSLWDPQPWPHYVSLTGLLQETDAGSFSALPLPRLVLLSRDFILSSLRVFLRKPCAFSGK
jgi:hypothetical protein